MLEIKNAGDQEWLNARGKKSLRSARWHLCSLSLASLLLDPTVACTLHFQCYTVQRSLPISVLYIIIYNDLYHYAVLAVQRSLPSVSDRHIYIYIYLYTLAQIRPPMLQDYSPHAKALGNYYSLFLDARAFQSNARARVSLQFNIIILIMCMADHVINLN